jgi:hypothetical protein
MGFLDNTKLKIDTESINEVCTKFDGASIDVKIRLELVLKTRVTL